jgi:hypothetical protein
VAGATDATGERRPRPPSPRVTVRRKRRRSKFHAFLRLHQNKNKKASVQYQLNFLYERKFQCIRVGMEWNDMGFKKFSDFLCWREV